MTSGALGLLRRAGLAIWVVVATLGLAEAGLRLFATDEVDFYGVQLEPHPGLLHYPFGTIFMNHEGFPDADWGPPDGRPRIGWLGDSVVYGIGAGGGHRFTDHLARLRPDLEHLNLGKPGYEGPYPATWGRLRSLVRRHRIDRVVYVLNLNDIGFRRAPRSSVAWGVWTRVRKTSRLAAAVADRVEAWRNPQVFGLYPSEYPELVQDAARRIEAARTLLGVDGVELSVVLLPGEMQVSTEAARFYAARGVGWEPGAETGSPQRAIKQELDPAIAVVDLLDGFVDPADPEGSRAGTPMCAYFVCTAAGRLDWNHLDRHGHQRVAELLANSAVLPRQAPKHQDDTAYISPK